MILCAAGKEIEDGSGQDSRTNLILPSLHNRTHSKVEAVGQPGPRYILIVTMNLQQSG